MGHRHPLASPQKVSWVAEDVRRICLDTGVTAITAQRLLDEALLLDSEQRRRRAGGGAERCTDWMQAYFEA